VLTASALAGRSPQRSLGSLRISSVGRADEMWRKLLRWYFSQLAEGLAWGNRSLAVGAWLKRDLIVALSRFTPLKWIWRRPWGWIYARNLPLVLTCRFNVWTRRSSCKFYRRAREIWMRGSCCGFVTSGRSMNINPRGALRPVRNEHESHTDQEEDSPSGHGLCGLFIPISRVTP